MQAALNVFYWVRFLLLFPAYIVGLGVGPLFLMLLFNGLHIDVFQHSVSFFVSGSCLSSIGSSLMFAWVVPSGKYVAGALGAALTGILGPIVFLTNRGEFDAPQIAVFFGYICGTIVAIVLLRVMGLRSTPVFSPKGAA